MEVHGEHAVEICLQADDQDVVDCAITLTSFYRVCGCAEGVNVDCVCLCSCDRHPIKFCAKKKRTPAWLQMLFLGIISIFGRFIE